MTLPALGRNQAAHQFNNPTFVRVKLTSKQKVQIGSIGVHQYRKDENGLPIASWYAEYADGAIPVNLEVFRVRVTKDWKDIYELREISVLPAFLLAILGDKVETEDGRTIDFKRGY